MPCMTPRTTYITSTNVSPRRCLKDTTRSAWQEKHTATRPRGAGSMWLHPNPPLFGGAYVLVQVHAQPIALHRVRRVKTGHEFTSDVSVPGDRFFWIDRVILYGIWPVVTCNENVKVLWDTKFKSPRDKSMEFISPELSSYFMPIRCSTST